MKNVLEFLEKTAKFEKEKIAVIEEDKKCTYSDLLNISKKVGSEILNYSKDHKPVPILMEKGIDALISFFGSVYAGCFYVLLNPDFPEVRLQNILENLDAEIIITDENNYDLANTIKGSERIIKIDELKNGNINETRLKEIREQALEIDPLYINFTSGSTGKPKGVVISHRTVIDFINIFTDKFNITNKDIIGNQAPFDFDVSVKDIYSAISVGATLVIIPKRFFSKPAELLDYIDNNKVTTLIWAVSALCLITTFHGLDYKTPKTVNKILFSGEVMPLKHIKQWIVHLPDATYVNLYGPTEITCNCTYHIVDKELKYEKQIPIGKAFENEQIILLNDDNKEVINENETGEICVRGTALALGYYSNKEQTNEKFIQNPLNDKYIDMIYKTGDLGYYFNGELHYSGRKDFQIKHQGHRIELEEIEKSMEKIDDVDRACCIYNHEKSKIIGFYIGSIDSKGLKEELKNILPIYMLPNILKNIETFPITKNGKIDRKALFEMI